ncbi:hypothetical protein KP509_31G049700 [Ceratopteris richardii]|uniref:Uncharacterized protein n=1 Tax=Ceratopteris richardii TaxID=49495 RepID=A0A8T2QYI8_CERRI|nr:hypothetical protein KP509_31G049700 [Ceratopteris richardii]
MGTCMIRNGRLCARVSLGQRVFVSIEQIQRGGRRAYDDSLARIVCVSEDSSF